MLVSRNSCISTSTNSMAQARLVTAQAPSLVFAGAGEAPLSDGRCSQQKKDALEDAAEKGGEPEEDSAESRASTGDVAKAAQMLSKKVQMSGEIDICAKEGSGS